MISVITTTYHGGSYLPKLLSMIESNAVVLQTEFPREQIEYILVNDSPWEPIVLPDMPEMHFQCKVLENPENFGIHKSRARGIMDAAGEIITMLDQDDEIAGDFLLSQYKALGNADAVVCNGWKEFDNYSKVIYRDTIKMRLVNYEVFYLKAANQIVSPGHCLIRKKAIPQSWLENPLETNGSDDLFLWLLMLDRGTRFVRNPAKLYIHKQTGENLSNSLEKMCKSDMEMCAILRQKKLLSEKSIRQRERMCAFLKDCGYRNRPTARATLQYMDVLLLKLFAYII